MPLADATKNAITHLTTLLSLDAGLCLAVRSSAERLLSPANAATIFAILGKNANGQSLTDGQAALVAVAGDVAAG